MSNEPFIPEASDPDTYVRGRLVPPLLARQVRLGWRVGIAYIALKVVAIALLLANAADPVAGGLAGAEVVLAVILVRGVYRWHQTAAWLLLTLLVVTAFAAALQSPQVPAPGASPIRMAFLVGFGVIFGRAALAIRSFERNA